VARLELKEVARHSRRKAAVCAEPAVINERAEPVQIESEVAA
jgi:hypothetical protein